VRFGNTEISSGMFYYGERLRVGRVAVTQYAINPRLATSTTIAEISGRAFAYSSSYASISPAARLAFLNWMRSGRKDPDCGIGYVWIFFYGLEHRVFVDKGPEIAAIIEEVERLRSIYGGDNIGFDIRAARFLESARISAGIHPLPPPLDAGSLDAPVILPMRTATRLYLGAKLARNPALCAEDALRLLVARSSNRAPRPVERCFEEFRALWTLRFAQRFPDGFAVNTKQKIELRYRSASGAWNVLTPGKYQLYPDPCNVKELSPLEDLIEECGSELRSYNRFLERKPSSKGSMAAVALLPVELQSMPEFGGLAAIRKQIERVLETAPGGRMTAAVLFEMAGIAVTSPGRIPRGSFEVLGRVLDGVDVAMEPDERYGSGRPRSDEQVCVFKAAGGGPIDPKRPAFRAMRAQVDVMLLASAADGEPLQEDLERIKLGIRGAGELSGLEQKRLAAVAETMFTSPPKRARVLRSLAEIGLEERERIADAAIALIAGNRSIARDGVRFLERLQAALGLARDRIYSALHRAGAVGGEAVGISEEVRVAGLPVRAQKRDGSAGFRIDAARLAQAQLETESVAVLLADIFAGDDAPVKAKAAAEAKTALQGLDGPHGRLVKKLQSRGSMTRAEFDQAARALRLLPDGAIECINDWSFDRFDEPLIEEGADVWIAPHLRARLNAK